MMIEKIKQPGEKFADCRFDRNSIKNCGKRKNVKKNCVEIKKRNEKKTKLVKIKSNNKIC